MMKNVHKALAILLVLSALLTMSGCFGSDRSFDTPDPLSTTTTAAAAPTEFPAYDPPATIPSSYYYTTEPHRAFEMVHVPDLSGTDAESAKTILVNCGLVPVIQEEFSNFISQGLVTRSEPGAFAEVERGTRVTIYVSRGLSQIKASNFRYNWMNKVDNYAPAAVKVEQIFVEEDMLYLDFNFRMEYYESSYRSPVDYDRWYLYFDSFSVNIEGNTIAATAMGDAANGFVEHSDESLVYSMRLQIPLNAYTPHTPSSVEVFCKIHTKQVYCNGIGRNGEGGYTCDYKFSANNITW